MLAEVRSAEVGRDLTMGVAVSQPFRAVAVNLLDGVVTESAGSVEAQVGTRLYAVAGRPVWVVAGEVPFWRDLEVGVEGVDVEQLQVALTEMGHFHGAADGQFDSQTETAVRAWQDSESVPATGIIGLGEIIAIPNLPQSVQVGEEITPGALVGTGTTALRARAGDLNFEMVLSADQAALVPAKAQITVQFEDAQWPAIIASQQANDSGQQLLTLTAPDGGPVCGADCDLLPVQESINLLATVEVTPYIEGPAVPVTAIRTSTDGSTYVIRDDGVEVPVEILGSSGGVAVVEGLEDGQQVHLGSGADESRNGV